MKIINPSFDIVSNVNTEDILNSIERAYRICYRSEPKENRNEFIATKIKAGHESPLEHEKITVEITTDRGVTHELVRHRIASYSQESQRYCGYNKDKFDNQIRFIKPAWVDDSLVGEWRSMPDNISSLSRGEQIWAKSCLENEVQYMTLLNSGWQPQQARQVLNNSVATTIIVTMNIREWRHFFKLRAVGTTGRPHPNMLQISIPMLAEFKKRIPVVFDDIEVENVE